MTSCSRTITYSTLPRLNMVSPAKAAREQSVLAASTLSAV